MSTQALLLQKGLDSLENLLTTRRTKEAQLNSAPITIEKAGLTILTQMISSGSPKVAQGILGLFGETVFQVVYSINKSGCLQDTIDKFIDTFKADRGRTMFSISPKTLGGMLDKHRIEDADRCLEEQSEAIHASLKKKGICKLDNIYAIDPTHKEYRGKYRNQCHPWGYKGQKETYRRGFTEVPMFQQPYQFFTNNNLRLSPGDIYKVKRLPTWIPEIQHALRTADAQGFKTNVIYGDREYYSGIGMAFAYFNLLVPQRTPGEGPRLIVPSKLRNGSQYKWDFLLSSSIKIIDYKKIELDHYQKDFLGPNLLRLPKNSKGTKYYVPVAQVAVFDNYSNGHKRQSLKWGQNEAQEMEKMLTSYQHQLKAAESKYLSFQKKMRRKDQKIPNYTGKRRWSFKIPQEKLLYRSCCSLFDRLQDWKKKKSKLIKRLMFFTVSLHEGEVLSTKMDEIYSLIEDYSKRWGIENGFKHLQEHFLVKTNKRGAAARHVRFVASELIYNSWHYYRIIRSMKQYKRIRRRWRHTREKMIEHITGIERGIGPILTADGYILELMKTRLKSILKNYF